MFWALACGPQYILVPVPFPEDSLIFPGLLRRIWTVNILLRVLFGLLVYQLEHCLPFATVILEI